MLRTITFRANDKFLMALRLEAARCRISVSRVIRDAVNDGIGFGLTTASADNSSASVTAADILALNIDYA